MEGVIVKSQALIRNLLLLFLIVFLVSSTQAEDQLGISIGGQTIHGGSADLAKAGGDTINLMAASNDPTNNSDPRDGGLEPYYDGDFEDANGDPSWNGWTHVDLTQPTESHWNVSNYNQPDPANYAAWCGNIDFVSCGLPDPDGGYGNYWNDVLEYRQTVPNPGTSSTVSITATLIYDSEPGYDYTYLSYKFNGQFIADLHSWDDAGTVDVIGSVTYLPQEYLDSTDIAVYFRFQSDIGWSDEDCSWPTAGACQVDDINVHLVNGVFTGDFFEDFEHDGDPADFGLWNIAFPDGVGDYAKIWTGLEDADPCNTNYTPQVAFIDDGIVVPGTGGSECINWCYGPAGYIVTTTGGLAGQGNYLLNAIESPVMAWPEPKNAGDPDYDGITLTFGVYVHEELSASSPGIFYSFQVRSADTDGSAGDPQIITEQNWRNWGYWYASGPEYRRKYDDVTSLMNPGRDEIQVRLEAKEFDDWFGYTGHNGTPAPYFDNVTVKVFPVVGPSMDTFEGLDLAHDDFPERGSIDTGDLGSHSVRFDMEKAINYSDDLGYDFGDSLVVKIVSVRAGADLDGDPEMHYILDSNPVFDPYRTAGLPAIGSVTGLPAVGATGEPSPGMWAFDLPDTGFLFPGDVLHYYFSSTDAIGGLGGSNPQTALMPADTTGFSTGFGDPLGYHPVFTVQALPSIRPDGEGGYEQPGILVINDDRRLGMPEWHTALNNIGLLVNEDYDMYVVNSSSANNHSGIGARATHLTLGGYDDILYTSGNQGVWTLGNGNGTSDDVTPLTNWLDLGGKDIFLTGDELAHDLSQTGTAALTFLENYMGVTLVVSDVRSFIGNQSTPLVKVIADNPVFNGTLETWIAFGSCPNINTFDGLNTIGTGQRIAEFTDSAGQGGQYTFSAATLNIMANGSRAISMPVAFSYIYTDPAAPGNLLPGRAQLLRDVLQYFNIVGDPQQVSPVPPVITFQTSNYPNPFNPSTTIKYSMPTAGHLKLSIYNVRGQLVKTLIDGNRPAGSDQTIIWDGTNNQGSATASGVYFYEARTGGEVKIRKMALLK